MEDVNEMRGIKAGIDEVKKANPNFLEIAAKEAFRSRGVERVADPIPPPPRRRFWRYFFGKIQLTLKKRK